MMEIMIVFLYSLPNIPKNQFYLSSRCSVLCSVLWVSGLSIGLRWTTKPLKFIAGPAFSLPLSRAGLGLTDDSSQLVCERERDDK
jgi:hypothetical protein